MTCKSVVARAFVLRCFLGLQIMLSSGVGFDLRIRSIVDRGSFVRGDAGSVVGFRWREKTCGVRRSAEGNAGVRESSVVFYRVPS